MEYVYPMLGLLAAVAIGGLGWWCITLDGHVARLREENRGVRFRLDVFWKLIHGHQLSELERSESDQMAAESRETDRREEGF